MSCTRTGSRRNAAVPQEPATGPIGFAIDRFDIVRWQARGGAMAKVNAVAIQKKHWSK